MIQSVEVWLSTIYSQFSIKTECFRMVDQNAKVQIISQMSFHNYFMDSYGANVKIKIHSYWLLFGMRGYEINF